MGGFFLFCVGGVNYMLEAGFSKMEGCGDFLSMAGKVSYLNVLGLLSAKRGDWTWLSLTPLSTLKCCSPSRWWGGCVARTGAGCGGCGVEEGGGR